MRPWMICSLRVRKKRSATPLVCGCSGEGVARFHSPEAHLVAEVLGDVLRAVVHAQGEPPASVRREAAEVLGEALRHRLQGGEAVAPIADVAPDYLAAVAVSYTHLRAHE